MGFLDKLKGMGDDLKRVARDVQDQVTATTGSAPAPPSQPSSWSPPPPPGAPPLKVPPVRLDVPPPTAAEVGAAVLPPDADRVMLDWDQWADPGDVAIGPTTARQNVGHGWWEGVLFEGTDGRSAQVIGFELGIDNRVPPNLPTWLAAPQPRSGPFPGIDVLAVGLDAEGRPAAVAAVGDLGIFARLVGVAPDAAGLDAVHRLVDASLTALPG